MNKDRHIIAELSSFFAESVDFAIKNGLNFAGSVSGQMFACKKDMFYRFLSNEDINRRPESLAKLKLGTVGKC